MAMYSTILGNKIDIHSISGVILLMELLILYMQCQRQGRLQSLVLIVLRILWPPEDLFI